MRLAFMGSPRFSVPALEALHRAGHEIAAVYTQPARPAGRGQAVRPCPVQQIFVRQESRILCHESPDSCLTQI